MRLASHWAVSSPPPRAWLVTFDGQLDFLAAWLAPIVDRPYLSPVPPEWLHLILHAADTDDIAAVRERCAALAPVDALVGPVRVVEQGVAADMEPEDDLRALFEAVGGAGSFWPHVSFAYARDEADMDELEVNASDAVLIRDVKLVDLVRDGEVYRWDIVEAVSLAV